ncbi:acylphosphatase [Bosea vestrisii]|uniref:acylphosphatase n=1 Tax=Bosea vestrisii TaxID=151416 RepID=UPI0024DFE4B1|nr:acylphosphatase [Bosea vestrisii]WID99340.1 acylphosphatase [Bosea vestrisii]
MDLHISIAGRVQGVGYRQWFRGRALTAGVSGWVRNCVDGTVEAALSGPAESVERLALEARQGPRGAEVEEVRRLEAARGWMAAARPSSLPRPIAFHDKGAILLIRLSQSPLKSGEFEEFADPVGQGLDAPCVDGSPLARVFERSAGLVGAAMCSTCWCGAHGRWP